jgi:hypothetical protein
MRLDRRKISFVFLPITLLLLLAVTVIPVSAEYTDCCSCSCGCTLTPGYWKTHSKYGPATYDTTWNGQEDWTFWHSGKTIYEVLWTNPKGNAYYILAHQYIAAKLNVMSGTFSPPEVTAAINWAYNFFVTYAPDDNFSKEMKEEILYNKDILDQYNNGLIGPGHCSD